MNSFRLYLYSQIVRWLPETRFFGLKVKLLRWCGATIGENVRICSSTTITGTGNLVIGDDVWIGARCLISANGDATIRIGSHLGIAPFCYIATGSHKIDPIGLNTVGEGTNQDVTIEDGVWVAVRVTILPNVTIGKKALVCSGAVVTRDVAPRTIVAGIPAKPKGKIDD